MKPIDVLKRPLVIYSLALLLLTGLPLGWTLLETRLRNWDYWRWTWSGGPLTPSIRESLSRDLIAVTVVRGKTVEEMRPWFPDITPVKPGISDSYASEVGRYMVEEFRRTPADVVVCHTIQPSQSMGFYVVTRNGRGVCLRLIKG